MEIKSYLYFNSFEVTDENLLERIKILEKHLSCSAETYRFYRYLIVSDHNMNLYKTYEQFEIDMPEFAWQLLGFSLSEIDLRWVYKQLKNDN